MEDWLQHITQCCSRFQQLSSEVEHTLILLNASSLNLSKPDLVEVVPIVEQGIAGMISEDLLGVAEYRKGGEGRAWIRCQ